MREKSKKGKGRIKQWQFILAWIGGQYASFFVMAVMGILGVNLLGLVGFTMETFPMILQFGVAGAALGLITGWVQQWSIRKRFGHDVKGWRFVSAVLTGIIFMIVIPLVQREWSSRRQPTSSRGRPA